MSADLNLAAIEARAAAATEGPWEDDGVGVSQDCDPWDAVVSMEERGRAYMQYNVLVISDEDRAFIAHARTDVPALIARIRELEAENAKIDDLDEALRQRDREILGLRRDRDARDARIAELEGDG